MMERRRALVFVSVALSTLGWTAVASAQLKAKPVLIGWLSTGTHEGYRALFAVFKERLAALGWKEGQHYMIEESFAQDRTDRLPFLAKELAAKRPALIVTSSAQATAAAAKAAPDTPIVMATGADPVLAGFAKSLARPAGMITGLSNFTSDITAKYLELLLDAAPTLTRIGFLVDSKNLTRTSLIQSARRSAGQLRVDARIAEIAGPDDIEPTISRLVKEGAQALVVMSSPTLFETRRRILQLAQTHRWPVISSARQWTVEGALMSYGVNSLESFGRAAHYVDRILKGAKPGDLPIEQPTKLEFVINLKTAKALGITIPQSLLLRADRVIE